MHDAVDVAGEGCLLGVESLALQRAGEDRAEHDSGTGADQRRCEQKYAQQRERPLEVAPALWPPHTLVHRLVYRPRGAGLLALVPRIAEWISTSSSSARPPRCPPRSAGRLRCSSGEAASGSSSTAARGRSGSCSGRPSACPICRRSSSRTSTPTTSSACPEC